MSDRELLEMAAKAARVGAPDGVRSDGAWWWYNSTMDGEGSKWNPLANDGDALRLAVKLSIRIEPYSGVNIHPKFTLANITDVYSLHDDAIRLSERHDGAPDAATRRAIVRAAAEIGSRMP